MMSIVAGPIKSNNIQEAVKIAQEKANGGNVLLLDLENSHSTLDNTSEMRVIKYNVASAVDLMDALHDELLKTDVLIVDGILEVEQGFNEFLEQLKSWEKPVIVTYPIDGDKLPETIRAFFSEIIYLTSTIPTKTSRYFDEIVTAVYNEDLLVMNGLFNGSKRTFLSIRMKDADPDFEKVFPRAVIIDLGTTLPKKASQYLDEIVNAVHNGTLFVKQGQFYGEERTLLYLHLNDAPDFPRAVIVDSDIDSLHDIDGTPIA